VRLVPSSSYHARRGAIENSFSYHVDYLLLPVHEEIRLDTPLIKHNKFGLFSFYDKDHGPFEGQAENRSIADIADEILDSETLREICDGDIWLYTQPRFLGFVFNPVSFWFFMDKQDDLRVVLAEVNNRAGGRHFYICRHDGFDPIKSKDRILVEKIFHVSPFQDREGTYKFRFKYEDDIIGGWIDYENGDKGLYATLSGHIAPIRNRKLLKSALLRPFGAMRVVWLIYWQALKLKTKGAKFRSAPKQKDKRISR